MSSKNCRQLLHPQNHQHHSSNCISNYESGEALDNTIAIVEYQLDSISMEYEYVDMIEDDEYEERVSEGGMQATSSSVVSSNRNYVPYDAERMPVQLMEMRF